MMNIRAINRETGKEWKAREGYIEFLMRFKDEYKIFTVVGRTTTQQILDLNVWEIKKE